MPKIKQTLKSQLTLRIYNQEDKDILDKAYNRTKSGFDNLSDFIVIALLLVLRNCLEITKLTKEQI